MHCAACSQARHARPLEAATAFSGRIAHHAHVVIARVVALALLQRSKDLLAGRRCTAHPPLDIMSAGAYSMDRELSDECTTRLRTRKPPVVFYQGVAFHQGEAPLAPPPDSAPFRRARERSGSGRGGCVLRGHQLQRRASLAHGPAAALLGFGQPGSASQPSLPPAFITYRTARGWDTGATGEHRACRSRRGGSARPERGHRVVSPVRFWDWGSRRADLSN